jgi:hypothetical protein
MCGDNNIPLQDLYKIALKMRNFEIKLFWQRSNYFLVLTSATAIGFFSLSNTIFAFALSIFGLLSSIFWFLVNSGSKYWQSRWEHRLYLIEAQLNCQIAFFFTDRLTCDIDVRESLQKNNHNCIRKLFD